MRNPGSDQAAPKLLSTEAQRIGNSVVVAVRGELDMVTAPSLTACIEKLYGDEPAGIVLDVDGLSFIGSAGLAALISSQEQATKRHCGWALVATRKPILRTFQLTGLEDQLAPYRSVEEALSAAA